MAQKKKYGAQVDSKYCAPYLHFVHTLEIMKHRRKPFIYRA